MSSDSLRLRIKWTHNLKKPFMLVIKSIQYCTVSANKPLDFELCWDEVVEKQKGHIWCRLRHVCFKWANVFSFQQSHEHTHLHTNTIKVDWTQICFMFIGKLAICVNRDRTGALFSTVRAVFLLTSDGESGSSFLLKSFWPLPL